MKITIKSHTLTLDEALEWFVQYVESSFVMQDKYLTPVFADSVLSILYNFVPAPTEELTLYRVLKLNKPVKLKSHIELNPGKKMASWTQYSKKSDWSQIADDVGLLGEENVYVVSGKLKPLTTPAWVRKLQKKLAKDKSIVDSRELQEFLELQPSWQKECLCYPTALKVQVVSHLEE